MKCPRCQRENPSHGKFCLECGAPFRGSYDSDRPGASYTDLQRALSEALEQQTATSEIVEVISSSPSDIQPVFNALAVNVARLCEAQDVVILRVDGDVMRLGAGVGPVSTSVPADFTVPLTRDSVSGRAILDRCTLHILDLAAEPDDEFPVGKVLARRFGHRTFLASPLLRESVALGVICVFRAEVRPFVDSQIDLLKTFANQAVIALENVRLFNETREALDQQTATAEILRVISASPTNVEPVFRAIARSATRLCDARFGTVFRFDGERITVGANQDLTPEETAVTNAVFPAAATRGTAAGRAIVERRVVHITDIRSDPDYVARAPVNALGYRTALAVPMLREGSPIGVFVMWRREVRPFTDKQIELVRTFADQAVIAIENVRLFRELEARNTDLAETLAQQTATADILRSIAASPTDYQPVFDTIVRNAGSVCGAVDALLWTADGDELVARAHHGPIAGTIGSRQPVRGSVAGRAVSEARVVHVEDLTEADDFPVGRDIARRLGWRTTLSVPLLREGAAAGAILIRRSDVRLFTPKEIALLQTFADQAVIAIENVRLFTELQTSNRELTTALDTQTATSDILRVISRSQTDVQPVFDAILDSAVRLLRGYSGLVTRIAGDQIELAALTSTDGAGDAVTRAVFPQSHQSDGPHAQAMRDRAPINIADAQTDPRVPEAVRTNARARGNRSWVIVPLLRHDEAVGTIAVTRREPGGFTDDEIALLKTFADQAVIAIENARLLTELQARTQELTRSVEQLTALGDVGRAVSSSLDLDTVLTTIVSRAVQLSGTDGGTIFEYDEGAEEFSPRATLNADESQSAMLRATRLRRGEGAVGQMAVTREPLQIPDIAAEGAYESRLRGALLEAGTRAVLAIPLLHEERIVGGLVVTRRTPGAFTPEIVEILKTFATQSALAIQNARLFHEIERKSRQLEVASQHKSEFLANMSHELRTPLNAIIGFSEVLTERMFGELNEKQDEYLKDIYASGQHLLSLINDILDLSKIEAGRMELELADFHLPQAIDNALVLVRERALRRGITLEQSIDPRLGEIEGDERKIKQVLLNLLSNAIKFTPEGGRVGVRAAPVEQRVEVAVSDTGVGIALADHEAVFEEFRQVGAAEKKAEGTGLGLALARKFIELHGGRIWVKSQVGAGSTFTFTLPVRHGE
jgi:GAF domain-containing protein